MKLKFISTLFAAFFLFTPGMFSQTPAESPMPDSKKSRRSSITIDVTGLLHQFTSVSQYSASYGSPYFLILHRQFKKNALRISLGGYNNGTIDNPGDTVENTSTNFNMAVGVGVDCMRDLGKGFQADYGIEIGFQFSDSKSRYEVTQSTFVENQTSTGGVVLSPFLGIFWNLHPRLAIGTETNLRWGFFNTETNNKTEVYKNTYNEMRFASTFHAPVNLMVRMKF